jgi:hypothetical protein
MKKLGTALRLLTLGTLVFAALTAGTPQPVEAQMSCRQYCREVCIANGEPCCYITSNTCGCC